VKGKTGCIDKEMPTSNEEDSQGLLLQRNALHMAVCNGSYEEVTKQLKSLAREETFSSHDSTREIMRALITVDKFGFHPLHAAAVLQGEGGALALKMCRLLISSGAEVTTRDFYGNTAIHWATRVGNVNVMETLVYENCELGTL
jgi:ankyrin repeat protein